MEEHQRKFDISSWGMAIGIGVICSIVIIPVLLLCFAFLPLSMDISPSMLDFIIYFCVSLGGLTAGFVGSRIKKEKGLLIGAIIGILAALLLLLISCFFDSMPTITSLLKFLDVIFCSMLGGICGVNKHEKKLKF